MPRSNRNHDADTYKSSTTLDRLLVATILILSGLGLACSSGAPTIRGGVGYSERGIASWYGPGFHGRRTANGEVYDMDTLTAAHKTLPFDSVVEVRNRDNGKRVQVRINDRGPFAHGRIIDLSRRAAEKIDMLGPGTARVEIRVVSGPPAMGTGQFWVQAGAFQDRDKARDLYRELRSDYSKVRLESQDGWHRVRLGPYTKKKKAEKTRRDLRYDGISAVVLEAS
ncbi:MAG: septal ring lytic transglycosylase RlpA family protein [Acidobacteriota bacterium]